MLKTPLRICRYLRPVLCTGSLLVCFGSQGASLIDANFKLHQQTHRSSAQFSMANNTTNDVGSLYKNFLAKSMSSRCRWLPSDSQYMNLKTVKCGQARGTIFAFARFMNESNAADISKDIVSDNHYIRFLNFGDHIGENGCEIF